MTSGKVKSLLYEDTETSYNNWRGSWGEFTGWSVREQKQLRVHDAIYRRHKSVGIKRAASGLISIASMLS